MNTRALVALIAVLGTGLSAATALAQTPCTFDTSGCSVCGDGSLEKTKGEVCDGALLDGQSCASLGYASGSLGCSASCTSFDTSGCAKHAAGSCGNGVIDAGEDCDGSVLGGASCKGLGFVGGSVSCGASCTFDTSACAMCGDGSIQAPEGCDGALLGGATCQSLFFSGVAGPDYGTLSCVPSSSSSPPACFYATTSCKSSVGACWNGKIDTAEACDFNTTNGQPRLGGATCESLGFPGGSLGCYSAPGLGLCSSAADCNDNNACTNDTCNAGVCAHSNKVNGTVCTNDGKECTNDSCQAGVCTHPNKADGTACTTDGVYCNGSELCLSGNCVTGAGVDPCPDDGLTCTDECDEAGKKCINQIRNGHCRVFGLCYVDDDTNPSNFCQRCNSGQSKTAFSPKIDNLPCAQDGKSCNGDEQCLGGQCVVGAGPDPCPSDGLTCTVDCNEVTDSCDYSVVPGKCLIGGVCYAPGEANPTNSCQTCQPTVSALAWTNLSDGTACANDGSFCNGAEQCVAGSCVVGAGPDPCTEDNLPCTPTLCDEASQKCNLAQPGSCIIGGVCYADGDFNPASTCQTCQSSVNKTAWTNLANGTACPDDGVYCNGPEACFSGTCYHGPAPCTDDSYSCTETCNEPSKTCNKVIADRCFIGSQCYNNGEADPSNSCRGCIPTVSQTAWSPKADGAACASDGLYCNGDEQCISGTCTAGAGPDPCFDDGKSCTDTCSETTKSCNVIQDGKCLISGVCQNNGDLRPGTSCQACDSLGNQTAWSDQPANTPCQTDNLYCNGEERCDANGVCIAGAGPDPCNDDGISCTTTCDEPSHQCNKVQAGKCLIGSACYNNGDSNPSNECQACSSSNSGTSFTSKSNGTTCSTDSNECTDDVCSSGSCAHQPKSNGTVCTSDGNSCTTDACKTGNCSHDAVVDHTACADDGNGCTKDECMTGACSHPGKPDGTTCPADSNVCTDDQCVSGACSHPNKSDGSACTSDSNICTDDECTAGLCKHKINNEDCQDDNNDCTNDKCAMGLCQHLSKDGQDCDDDGYICTKDMCKGTVCAHPWDGDACECISNGDCDDNNECTTDECIITFNGEHHCRNTNRSGSCTDDGNPCTTDNCNNGSCEHPSGNDGSSCTSDGNECHDAHCHGGNCNGYKADGTACTADTNQCTRDECQSGSCQHPNQNDGYGCGSDGNECHYSECKGGTCNTNKPDDTPCTADTIECTKDVCQSGNCQHPNENDGHSCSWDSKECHENSCKGGKCNEPKTGNTCNDTFDCTDQDRCDNGDCKGTPDDSKCDDKEQCTDDKCDVTKGCQKTNRSGECFDGNPCTVGDNCSGGHCQPGTTDRGSLPPGNPLSCDDGNPCTTNFCKAPQGCDWTNLSGSCALADQCAIAPVCETGGCVETKDSRCVAVCTSHKSKDCPASNDQCQENACDPATGNCEMKPTNEGGLCNDGTVCNDPDTCKGGACTGANPFDPTKYQESPTDNPCTEAKCDSKDGTVSQECKEGKSCDASSEKCAGKEPFSCRRIVDTETPRMCAAGSPCPPIVNCQCIGQVIEIKDFVVKNIDPKKPVEKLRIESTADVEVITDTEIDDESKPRILVNPTDKGPPGTKQLLYNADTFKVFDEKKDNKLGFKFKFDPLTEISNQTQCDPMGTEIAGMKKAECDEKCAKWDCDDASMCTTDKCEKDVSTALPPHIGSDKMKCKHEPILKEEKVKFWGGWSLWPVVEKLGKNLWTNIYKKFGADLLSYIGNEQQRRVKLTLNTHAECEKKCCDAASFKDPVIINDYKIDVEIAEFKILEWEKDLLPWLIKLLARAAAATGVGAALTAAVEILMPVIEFVKEKAEKWLHWEADFELKFRITFQIDPHAIVRSNKCYGECICFGLEVGFQIEFGFQLLIKLGKEEGSLPYRDYVCPIFEYDATAKVGHTCIKCCNEASTVRGAYACGDYCIDKALPGYTCKDPPGAACTAHPPTVIEIKVNPQAAFTMNLTGASTCDDVGICAEFSFGPLELEIDIVLFSFISLRLHWECCKWEIGKLCYKGGKTPPDHLPECGNFITDMLGAAVCGGE